MGLFDWFRRGEPKADSPTSVWSVYHLRRIADALERAHPAPLHAHPSGKKIGRDDVTVVTDEDRLRWAAEKKASELSGFRGKGPRL